MLTFCLDVLFEEHYCFFCFRNHALILDFLFFFLCVVCVRVYVLLVLSTWVVGLVKINNAELRDILLSVFVSAL